MISRLAIILAALSASCVLAVERTRYIPSSTSQPVFSTPNPVEHVSPLDVRSMGDTSIAITDTTNTLQLVPASNGNLEMALITGTSANETWVSSNSTVLSDTSERFLIYYPSTMAASGVSRLRVAAWGSIPISSNIVFLTQFDGGDGNKFILAMDTQGNYFFPVACIYENLANKVFLVKDVSNLAFVADPSIQPDITGGAITECNALALTSRGLTTV